ncbi:hypothetical protein OPV22_027552 [Ensete ventricosum]|uniref:Myb-like domain-containing protein n=2 Tax=Ensete ventricosum TaxID=4639 RepID=A0AAV8PSD1_ENSVE|nr:hypothetical protein OPV22_027552 [Ensete ventricosum]
MQQQGGSRYGVPPCEMTQFSTAPPGSRAHLLGIPGPEPFQDPPLAEAPSPLSSRPPAANFDELARGAAGGNLPEDDGEGGGSGATGNRWPRQETLALLQIRSDMDSAFRDATLKGPLWEEVSRKLAELGYTRSAKKCKEKFENVHKYYKRTKDGRAGRQDGKSYRFFSQLEALHGGSSGGGGGATGMAGPPASRAQPISAVAPSTLTVPTRAVVPEPTPPLGPQGISSSTALGISFSSNSSSSASSGSDDEDTEEAGESQEGRKRKRGGGDSGSSRKMMGFFDRLLKQVMERQEAMQQRFLDAIEKREQDRMIRDEAWRRQEMTRLNREQELLAQERAMAASRDTAIISYLQKLSGQTIPMPTMPATPVSHAPSPQSAAPPRKPQPPPPPPITQQQQQRPPASVQSPSKQLVVQSHNHITEMARHQSSSGTELVPYTEPQDTEDGANLEPVSSSSRWPKAEVHALINLRSGLDSKYHEVGPKGPLWEEISAGMQHLGYNRSSKRCKEKWENINKYFKKVKDSNKHRPDDSKTCPYFHQLDALYRNRLVGSGSNVGTQRQEGQEVNPASDQQQSGAPMNLSSPPPLHQPAAEAESKKEKNCSNNSGCDVNSEGGGGSNAIQVQTGNGGLPSSFFDEGLQKTEVIVKELMGRQQSAINDYDKLNEANSDNTDKDEEADDDDDEDGKMQYKIQFQRQNVSAGSGGNTSTATAGSFLAIAQ